MNKKLKGLIAMALVTASVTTFTIPAIVKAQQLTGSEYKEMFSVDERKTSTYEELKAKWVELLTGNSISGQGDIDAINNIQVLDGKVEESLANKDLSEEAPFIWESLIDSGSTSASITAHMKRIKEISVAYNTKDSRYYQNVDVLQLIKDSINKIYSKHYNENVDVKNTPNNWWDWEIGTPKELADILVLVGDELGELKQNLIKTVDTFVPDATKRIKWGGTETGANLIDKAQAVIIRAIAEGNGERLQHASESIESVFPYVIKGDGFYTDGSFVQHSDIAYTGSYGAVLINGLSNCLYILQDTEYKVDTKDYYNIFRWIKDSYEPIIATGGNVMDNVRGRAISRIAEQGDVRGRFIIASMLRIAEIAPNEEAENYIKSIAKRWIGKGSEQTQGYFKGSSTGDIAIMKNVINDASVEAASERNYYKQFYYMDRAVSNRPEYEFTVSMNSKRIANHEKINGESMKAWYTGMGMTQLYTNDLQQYNEDFWPTVDPYRLPGVTSDGQTRMFGDRDNASDWAGGTTVDGINGVSGMEILPQYRTIDEVESGMSARKSWFMFEDEIVAVGSNISSDTQNVETIIDNRKIKDDASNTLLVDGKETNTQLGEGVINANWAHLEGNVENSDIGYVFPNETEIKTKRETRTHQWSEINSKAEFIDYEDKTRSYVSLAVDHGSTPQGGAYEYIMLPNATADKTAEYSANNPIKVLANTETVHAVYHEEEKIYAVNVFEAGTILDGIEVNGPISLMIKEVDGKYDISVSNPTKNMDSITLTLANGEMDKLNISEDVIVDNNTIIIDSSGRTGESYTFSITPKHVAVESLTLDKTEVKLKVGEKSKLEATINPDNATNKEVQWMSSDEEIVKVNENGEIEALKAGEAIIKAIVDDKEAVCAVNVVNDEVTEENKPGTDNENKPGNGGTNIDKPQTGDANSVLALGLTLVASASGITVLKKRKNK